MGAALKAQSVRKQTEEEAQLKALQKKRKEAAAMVKLKVPEQAAEEGEVVQRPILTTSDDPGRWTLQFIINKNNNHTKLQQSAIQVTLAQLSLLFLQTYYHHVANHVLLQTILNPDHQII